MKIGKGFIEDINDLGLYTVSPEGRRTQPGAWLDTVRPLFISDTTRYGEMLGRQCLYVSLTETETYLLGIFLRDEDMQTEHIKLEDGETLIWAGDYRIFYTSPNGIGIYTAKRLADGTIEKEPVFEYRKENESISMHVDNFMLDLLGAGTRGNIIFEQDSTGNFVYIFEGKTRLDDKNVRFRLRISNPILPINTENVKINPDGILELMVDTVLSPIKGASALEYSKPITIKMGANQRSMLGGSILCGMSINYSDFCEIMLGSKPDDPEHMLSITAGGSMLRLDTFGKISAKTVLGNKIILKPDGITQITSPAGVCINISKTGMVRLTSPRKVTVESPNISLKGEININTLPGQPGFCKQIICPMTGALLTTDKVGGSGV